MGVRTYEVTVNRVFEVKGCSNKAQVMSAAPLEMFEGEQIISVKEVRPAQKEMPMPKFATVKPRKSPKKAPVAVAEVIPEVTPEEVVETVPTPDLESAEEVVNTPVKRSSSSGEGLAEYANVTPNKYMFDDEDVDLSEVVDVEDKEYLAENVSEERTPVAEEVIEDDFEDSEEEPFYENVTNVDFVTKKIVY